MRPAWLNPRARSLGPAAAAAAGPGHAPAPGLAPPRPRPPAWPRPRPVPAPPQAPPRPRPRLLGVRFCAGRPALDPLCSGTTPGRGGKGGSENSPKRSRICFFTVSKSPLLMTFYQIQGVRGQGVQLAVVALEERLAVLGAFGGELTELGTEGSNI